MNGTMQFDKLPLEELAHVLRRVAIRLVEELLIEGDEPGAEVKESLPPVLREYLPKQELQVLAHSETWKIQRSRKTGLIPGDMRENLPKALKKLIRKSLRGKLTLKRWQIGATNRIALALGGTKGDIVPDDFWQVITRTAWCDTNFQLAISLKIIEWLRKTQLLAPYEFPHIDLSPNAFWVLIALTKVKPIRIRYWISKKERNRVRVERKLREIAQIITLTDKWAGFWDQWIIKTASLRWSSGFLKLDTRLCNALIELPIMNDSPISELLRTKQNKQKKRITQNRKPFSKMRIEKWFDVFDGILRLPRPLQSHEKYALLNLTAPGWETQKPSFFSEPDEEIKV